MRSEEEIRRKLEEVRKELREAEKEYRIIDADYYYAVKEALEWVLGEREEI